MVGSLLVTAAGGAIAQPTFPDVDEDHPFFTEIEAVNDEGVLTGFDDGTFRPTIDVTRRAAAAVFFRMAGEPAGDFEQQAADAFTDVTTETSFANEIGWLVSEGITTGFDDGTFKPGREVTRRAAAAFFFRFAGEPEGDYAAQAADAFTDITTETSFANEIGWLVSEGITTGFDDGTFRPGNNVTRQAFAAFVFRYLELGDEPGLFLTQERDVNPVDEPHTVTATYIDEDGTPVADGTLIRFEVYEAPGVGPVFNFVAGGDVKETEDGVATLTYENLAEDERLDYVIACAVENTTTPCTQAVPDEGIGSDDLWVDPVTGEPRNVVPEPNAYVVKEWQDRVLDEIVISQERTVNFTDEDHEVSVEAYDQFGDPFAGGATIEDSVDPYDDLRFEVHRFNEDGEPFTGSAPFDADDALAVTGTVEIDGDPDEDDFGTGKFSYNSPGPAPGDGDQDVILVCNDGTCAEVDEDGAPGIVTEEVASNLLTKDWAAVQDATTLYLDWNMEVTDNPGRFGNVSDDAARQWSYGNFSIRWNADAGIAAWEFDAQVTSPALEVGGSNLHIHAGAFGENGPIALGLPSAVLVPSDQDGPPDMWAYEAEGSAEGLGDELTLVNDAWEAADEDDLLDFYVNFHTEDNPAGEVRGQFVKTDTDFGSVSEPFTTFGDYGSSDGGYSELPPVFRMVDADDLDVPGLTGQQLALTFTQPMSNPDNSLAFVRELEAGDFTVTVNGSTVASEPYELPGSGVLDEPWPSQSTVQHINVAADLVAGDVVTVTIGEDAAENIVDTSDGNADLNDSVLSRTVVVGGEPTRGDVFIETQPDDSTITLPVVGDGADHPEVFVGNDFIAIEGQDVTANLWSYDGDPVEIVDTQVVTTDEDGIAEFDDLVADEAGDYVIQFITGPEGTFQYWTELSDVFTVAEAPVINILTGLGVTTDTTPTVTGNAQAFGGATIASVEEIEDESGTVTVTPGGTTANWSWTPDAALGDGVYDLEFEVEDSEGRTASATGTVTVDTTAPVVTDLTPSEAAPATVQDFSSSFTVSFDVDDLTDVTYRVEYNAGAGWNEFTVNSFFGVGCVAQGSTFAPSQSVATSASVGPVSASFSRLCMPNLANVDVDDIDIRVIVTDEAGNQTTVTENDALNERDNTDPTIENVTTNSATSLTVEFSEPVQGSFTALEIRSEDGTVSLNVTGSVSAGPFTEVTLTLSDDMNDGADYVIWSPASDTVTDRDVNENELGQGNAFSFTANF